MTFGQVASINLRAMVTEAGKHRSSRRHGIWRKFVLVLILLSLLWHVDVGWVSGQQGFFDRLFVIPEERHDDARPPGVFQHEPVEEAPPQVGAELTPPGQRPSAEGSTNRLSIIREAQLQAFDAATAQDIHLMTANVRLLTREAAVQWLSSFISSPPLSCPRKEQSRWVDGIISAMETNGLPLCKELLGLAASIISIESGYNADPPAVDPSRAEGMAELLARAEQEFNHRLGSLLYVPPMPGLYAEYREKYYSQLLDCRTEGDVEMVAKSIAEDLKRDSQFLPNFLRNIVHRNIDRLANVVRTKGSMQLNFNRAHQVMKRRGEAFTDNELSDYMYTLEGGIDVGVAALKPMFVQYAARYARSGDLSWLFFVGMDYHYGPFSSRNMMEQLRIRDLAGRNLAADGDFLFYDRDGEPMEKESETLRAAQAIFSALPREEILAAFVLEKDPHYIYTDIHRRIRMAHQSRFGETPFAVIGELWLGREAEVKHGTAWKTQIYLKKLDKYLNSVPWDDPAPQ